MAGENGIQVRVNGYGDVDRSRKGGTKEVKGTHARVMLSVVSSRRAVLVQGHGWWQWGPVPRLGSAQEVQRGDKGIKEPLHEHIVSYMLVTCGRSLSRVPCRCTTGAHSGVAENDTQQSFRAPAETVVALSNVQEAGGWAERQGTNGACASIKARTSTVGWLFLVRGRSGVDDCLEGPVYSAHSKNPACDLLGIGFEGAEGCELRQLDRPALMLIAACCSMLSYCRRAPTETHRLVKGSGES